MNIILKLVGSSFFSSVLLISLFSGLVHAVPFNDSFASVADLGSEPRLFRYADPRVATQEDFEFSLGSAEAFTPLFQRTGSLWFKWTAPSAGTYHVSGLDAGDLVDVYRNSGGNPGAFIEGTFTSSALAFSAAAGENFFIRHMGRLPDPFSFGPDAPPVGILLRQETTGNVTDFGTREAIAGYLTSFGAGNSEKYTWIAGKTGSIKIRVGTFSPSGNVELRVEGNLVPDFAFELENEIDVTAGDVLEVTLSGDLGFAQFNVTPEDPGSSDLGGVANAVIPSRPGSGLAFGWTWTAPADGIFRLEYSSSVPSSFSGLDIYETTTFDGSFIELSERDADCEVLGYKSAVVIKVDSGDSYAIQEGGAGLGFNSGNLTLKFFSTAVTLNERIDAATANLDQGDAAGLAEADAQLAAALAMDPAHAQANALRAVTRLLLLERDPAYAAFLQSLNISGAGTSIFDANYALLEDIDGRPIFPAAAGATERIAALKALINPRLVEIRGYLDAAVASGDRRAYLAATGSFVLDDADILALKATINIMQSLFDLLSIYDLGGSLNAIVQLEREGQLNLEVALAEFPALLNVASSTAIADFKARITDANTQLCAALILAGGSRTECGRHPFPPDGSASSGEDFLGFIEGLGEINAAFSGPVDVGGEIIDLSMWNSSTASLRSFLPTVRENRALAFTGSDPTLGGIFPNANDLENPLEGTIGLADPAGFSMYMRNLLGDGLPPFFYDFDEDSDFDGESNGKEYLFGSNPANPSVKAQGPVAKLEMTPGGMKFRVSFVRRLNSTDIRYIAAVSEDMKTWDYSEAKVTLVGSPVPVGDGQGEVVTVEIDSDLSGSMFVRIHAVAN